MSAWPIAPADVERARERLLPHLPPTPLRSYPELDAAVGRAIRVVVKHENFQPTGAFKVRNGVSALTASVTQGLNAASQIGDDRLQMESQGYIVPDAFTQGTSDQRTRWFRRGLETGSVEGCDTFRAPTL